MKDLLLLFKKIRFHHLFKFKSLNGPWLPHCSSDMVARVRTLMTTTRGSLTFSLYFSPKIVLSSRNSVVYFGGTRLPLLVVGPMKAQLLINYYNF